MKRNKRRKRTNRGPKEGHPLTIELMKLWVLIKAWLFQPKIKAIDGEVCLKDVNELGQGQIVCIKNWGSKKKSRYVELILAGHAQLDSFIAVNVNGGRIRKGAK